MYTRSFPSLLLFLFALVLASSAATHAQSPGALIAGVVIDEAGSVIPGARVTIADDTGVVVQTTSSDGAGAFSFSGVPTGTWSLSVAMELFSPFSQIVTTDPQSNVPVRAVLKAGGFAESVVVTARRVETRLTETPQKVEVIDATDIERSVAADITDVLKKNAGVDVLQYTGALSGVGIRGFRPQISGINKRSLLLVDGRPSGVTNIATVLLDNVERIEVLKGAASAVYGSSAMGGVINVITRQSRGKIGGNLRIGGGSFGTSEVAGRAGGSISSAVDFDAAVGFLDQGDIRMGNGETRPATGYTTYDGGGRLGVKLNGGWRLDGRIDLYRGRDINTPPDIQAGTIGQGRKNLERTGGDARLTGRVATHDLSLTAYTTAESNHTSNVTSSNPLDLPYLPFLSFESQFDWAGMQAKDAWTWSRWNSIVLGVDYEHVTSVSRSYLRTGEPTAPFSADSNKRTAGVYAENTMKFGDGRTVVTAGARVDRITTETVVTPLKINFTPSETTFRVFNPSVGITHALASHLRAHFAIGRGFIPAEASFLTGFTTTIVGGRVQISQGNPNLKPERSTSFDIGAAWTDTSTRLDVTAFRTVVNDRFITNVVVSNPAPPDPIVLSVTNGLDAHISGLDIEAERRLGARVGVFGNATHYFGRKERLPSGEEQDILNVPVNTIRAGVDVDVWRLGTRVSGRYVQGRKDNNFNAPGFPIVNYDNFTVVDASVTYNLARRHAIVATINNMFDAFYYEKLGYPLQGASFRLSYRLGF